MGKCNTQFLHAQRLHQLTLAARSGQKGYLRDRFGSLHHGADLSVIALWLGQEGKIKLVKAYR
jgi:hypothetical protein